MIKGKKRVPLTTETILALITELQIYEKYMPHKNWDLNQVCISPFPKLDGTIEKNPSFVIGNRTGNITHYLYSNPEYKGDCFSFVKQILNLNNLDEVLRTIDKDFNLGIISGNVRDFSIIKKNTPEEHKITKRNTLIQVVTKAFTKEELAYWSQFHLSREDLKDIYSIKKLYLNKKLFTFKDNELKFGYFYPEFGAWKIYRPLSSRKEKWTPNNVPGHALDYKENIKNCETAWINKSRKDTLVVKKVFPSSIGVQNESIGCFTEENIKYIKSNSKKQILSFDSDTAGVSNSILITKKYGFSYCNVPRKYLEEGIKDWAQLVHVYGMKELENILKEKQLL